jgi:hypothetical protein
MDTDAPTPADSAARAIRTPRAAAIAGIVFSVLFAASLVLVEWAIPDASAGSGTWVTDAARRRAVIVSLNLLPFAGIAFLWFIGVLRDRIGDSEDRLFATVFLGSGLLFVAMTFTAGAISAALVATAGESPDATAAGAWPFGRRAASTLATVYAIRMAAVFTISATTLASRLHLVPRWLAVLGYATAVVLLLAVGFVPWLELLFPAWVFVLSAHILVVRFRRTADPDRRTD